jgi:pre-mRNA-processing factor 19
VTKPKSLASSGIPGVLNVLQTEWDTVVLETFELRKHLESVRKNLAHALYQHDAACRVISRLTQERDEARQALSMTQEKLADYKDKLGVQDYQAQDLKSMSKSAENESIHYEQENCGIYQELNDKINSLADTLFKARKERKKPDDYYKPSDFNLLTQKGSFPLHSSKVPGVSSVGIHKTQSNYVCTGGNDGVAVIFDSSSNKVITSLINPADNDKIIAVEFALKSILLTRNNGHAEYWVVDLLSQSAELKTVVKGHPGTHASMHPLNPYFLFGASATAWGLYNMESGSKLCQVELEDDGELTSLTGHPDGLMMATGSSNGTVRLYDIRTQKVAATLKGHEGPVTFLQFSQKAIHLASVSTSENKALLWSLKKLKNPPQNIVHNEGSIKSVTFDPYGAYITTGCGKKLCFFETSNPNTCLFELDAHKDVVNEV